MRYDRFAKEFEALDSFREYDIDFLVLGKVLKSSLV